MVFTSLLFTKGEREVEVRSVKTMYGKQLPECDSNTCGWIYDATTRPPNQRKSDFELTFYF